MTQAVRITITGVFQGDTANPMQNTWWYIPVNQAPTLVIDAGNVIALLNAFAVNPWEDALALINDDWVTTTMQGDVFDTAIPAPFTTDVFGTKTSFIQPNGTAVGKVSNVASVASFIRPRVTKLVKSGGIRIGPVSDEDFTDNQPDNATVDATILNFVLSSNNLITGLDYDWFNALWGFPNENRLNPIIQGHGQLTFTRVTTQRSRLPN